MTPDSSAWRCPVCEGVNHGGRVCTTCGERLPEGFVPRDATPTVAAPASGAPPTVVRVPAARREPTFDDIFGPATDAPAPREIWAPTLDDIFGRATDAPVSPEPRGRRERREPPAPTFDDIFGPGY